jgi:hypothetical protein
MIQITNAPIIKTGTYFKLASISDDLSSTATLQYFLLDNLLNVVDKGTLTMTGTDYSSWDGSNEDAYTWALDKLGLERKTI